MKLRPLLAVPTFDNAGSIGAVVRQLLGALDLPLLVVDDGSRVPVKTVLAAAELAEGPRLKVLRLPRNRGKGAALQEAFQWALARGYTHVVTFDGDGQHLAESVPALLEAADRGPWSVVIGSRAFDGEHVPGASRFGRAFSNFWIKYETGRDVQDSQSGLRVYPLFFVQELGFVTRRYDFEVEALTRLLWAGAGLVEVPVRVLYPPAHERVSHFKKGRDNVRISLLNTWLVTLSLFRRHLALKKLALATVVGAALAVLPLSPAWLFLSFVLAAVLLQLNGFVLLSWYALAVSVPEPYREGVAAAGAGLAALVLSVGQRARCRRRAQWMGRNRGGRFGNFFLRQVSRYLGLGATYACLAFIAPYFYVFAPRAKRSSLEFFGALLPEASWLARRLHCLAQYYAFGMVLLDRLFQSYHRDQVFDVRRVGLPLFEEAAKGGKGVIILTAHAGGWDMSARVLTANHLGRGSVVAEFVAPDGITSESTVRAAEQGIVERASVHNEATPILAYKELLERGQVVGMMGDRPMSDKLELVPFMGRLAAFDATPFRLAMALGVDVLYCFTFKTGYRTYDLVLERALAHADVTPADRAAAGAAATEHYAAALERHLRRHPHQWFNFYPFFSTRPAT